MRQRVTLSGVMSSGAVSCQPSTVKSKDTLTSLENRALPLCQYNMSDIPGQSPDNRSTFVSVSADVSRG